MKICWDNLEGAKFTRNGNFFIKKHIYYEFGACKTCGENYLDAKKESKYCSESCKKENKKYKKLASYLKMGEKNASWKGGYKTRGIPRYDLYVDRLEPMEQCRRNKEDENILEVKCTYCGKWFIPTIIQVRHRVNGMNNKERGEARFYDSDSCKKECPIYFQKKYPKGHHKKRKKDNNLSREVQPELRQMRFQIDDYQCQRCGSTESLHCHHIDPVISNPIESADLDNCITFCKKCHIWIHVNIKGCSSWSLMNCGKKLKIANQSSI